MKRLKILILGLIFALILLGASSLSSTATASATGVKVPIEFELDILGKPVKFNSFEICDSPETLSKWGRNAGGAELLLTAKKIKAMGFSDAETVQFLFPGLKDIFDATQKKVNIDVLDAKLFFDPQHGKFSTQKEQIGRQFLREETASRILSQLGSGHIKIQIATESLKPKTFAPELLVATHKKSSFSTWCGNSSENRKHNIETAANAISGTRIEPGETFSFNKTTGERNADKGYRPAKIISNGTYKEGVGGGVCQVSTTLYNAAILAGLEVTEVHQHSLPVSYVEPSKDAMVSGSSCDLKIKNNTPYPVFLRIMLLDGQTILAEIFGEQNQLHFSVETHITKTLQHAPDEIVTDTSYSPKPLQKGEQIRISHSKDGCESEAYLIAKDQNGKEIFRKRIRRNRYAPTRGIIVQG